MDGTGKDLCAIDRLPDEVLWSILAHHVDDDRSLGACLLAWRRFHVLGVRDIQRRKYRCATVMSVCAAGDADGLRFVLDHADAYMPQGLFRWDCCLFAAATVAGSVATLTTIKQAIRAKGAEGSWPVHSVLWWSLAFGAAERGHDDALMWLCLSDNATSTQPTLDAEEVQTLFSIVDGPFKEIRNANGRPTHDYDTSDPESPIFLAPCDFVVTEQVKASMRALTPDNVDSLCDRVSRASGLDARAALGSAFFSAATRVKASCKDDDDDDGDGDSTLDAAAFDERLRQEIEADDDRYGHMVWQSIERGHLRDMEARFGREAIVRRIGMMPSMCVVSTASGNGHYDDAVWIYRALCQHRGRPDEWALSALVFALARANRIDLLEAMGCCPHGTPIDPSEMANEPHLWTRMAEGAAEGGHIPILESIRDRPIDEKDGGPVGAALEGKHLDAAAWLCAHGYNRVRNRHQANHGDQKGTQSFLYRAIRERRFDVVRVLLDPTVAQGIPRKRIDRCVTDAIVAAIQDALMAGDLVAVTWLRERYETMVDETVAHLRADRWPMCCGAPEAYDYMARLAAAARGP